jgi:hypothetical protein
VPSKQPLVITLRGTEAYRRYLARLAKLLRAEGLPVAGPNALAEHALAELGRRRGIEPPRRMPPIGRPPKAD